MKTYLHDPMDYTRKDETTISCDLDLPERRKIYTSSREKEDVDAHTCPCDTTMENTANIVHGKMCNIQGGTGCIRDY